MKHLLIISLFSIVYAQSPLQTNAVLQGLDFITTSYALNNGAVELNPIMEPITSQLPLMIAAKLFAYYAATTMNEKQLKWYNRYYAALVISNLNVIRSGL